MPFGRITHVDVPKKYGFVRPNGLGKRDEMFFSRDELSDEFAFAPGLIGERIDFDEDNRNPKGPRAVNLRPVRFDV